jgi:hypothetical protein
LSVIEEVSNATGVPPQSRVAGRTGRGSFTMKEEEGRRRPEGSWGGGGQRGDGEGDVGRSGTSGGKMWGSRYPY